MGQERQLLLLEMDVESKNLLSILHYNGLPMVAENVVDGLHRDIAKGRAA